MERQDVQAPTDGVVAWHASQVASVPAAQQTPPWHLALAHSDAAAQPEPSTVLATQDVPEM